MYLLHFIDIFYVSKTLFLPFPRFPSHYKIIASNELFQGTGMNLRNPIGSYRFLFVVTTYYLTRYLLALTALHRFLQIKKG